MCFGGGKALPETVLTGCMIEKQNGADIEIISCCTMTDTGGSSGIIRNIYGILSPGDIRRHLLTLSRFETLKSVLNSRVELDINPRQEIDKRHNGHNLFNIIIAEYFTRYGIEDGCEYLHSLLQVEGLVFPCITSNANLVAELENGQLILGEKEIDIPEQHDPSIGIVNIWLQPQNGKHTEDLPSVNANPEVIELITYVDVIVLGPGDLFSSVIPTLLGNGIKKAMNTTTAKKIIIIPAMTKIGETEDYYVEDYSSEIEKYIETEVDYVIYNTSIADTKRMNMYKIIEPRFINQFMKKDLKYMNWKFVGKPLLKYEGEIEYDPVSVVRCIMEVLDTQ